MDQTIQEKVQQAVTEAYEYLAQLHIADEALSSAKMAEDQARNASPVDTKKGVAAQVQQEAKTQAESLRQSKRQTASEDFDRAVVTRDRAVKEAEEGYEVAVFAVVDEYNDTVNQAIYDQENLMAVPAATVHQARQEVQALRATIKQHNRNVQKSLGINLDNLVSG